MVVTLGLNVGVCHQEHGEDQCDNIPSRENETTGTEVDTKIQDTRRDLTHVKVFATSPMFEGSDHAEKATIAGICNRQTWSAYADPISILVAWYCQQKFNIQCADEPQGNISVQGE